MEREANQPRLTWRHRPEILAYLPSEDVRNLAVSGHRRALAGRRVPVNRVVGALAVELAAVLGEVIEELTAFHNARSLPLKASSIPFIRLRSPRPSSFACG